MLDISEPNSAKVLRASSWPLPLRETLWGSGLSGETQEGFVGFFIELLCALSEGCRKDIKSSPSSLRGASAGAGLAHKPEPGLFRGELAIVGLCR